MAAHRLAIRPSPFSKRIRSKEPPLKEIEFIVGQKVVYPGHGVGRVQSIENKEIGSALISFYMIRILESGVMVMVPLNKVDAVGVRPVASPEEVQKVYSMLKEKKIVVEQTTWNRRFREYMEKIKTGSIFEISEVLRDLCLLRSDKVLSFGEKKMMDLAKGLLVKELAIAESSDEPTVEAHIEQFFSPPASH